jgi:nucleotide-binding universal stress UspA family protein
MTGRIVVGADGSQESVAAVRWAWAQAQRTGSALEAVYAREDPFGYGGYPLSAEVDWAGRSRQLLDETVTSALGEDAATVTRTVTIGHAAKVLTDAADGADLLVVGSRGHGGFAGMLLGSVSQHVVAHSPCPVVVVRGEKQGPSGA